MRIARVLIALFIIIFNVLPTRAEGYNVLVIPQSCVDIKHRANLGNIDIEELLVKKFVWKMEDGDIACAPALSVLKISILNNPFLHKDGLTPMENVSILSNSYGVPRVLLVSSKIEVQTVSQQRDMWDKLGLPVLIKPDSNMKVVTSVKLVNMKDNEVVYDNVFYKNISSFDMNELDTYYDEIIPKVIDSLKDSKQTHAIMVGSGSNVEVDDKKGYEYEPMISSKSRAKHLADKSLFKSDKKKSKVETDLEVKESFNNDKAIEASKKAKKGFLFRFDVMNIGNVIDALKKEYNDNKASKPYTVKKSVAKKLLKEKQVDKNSKNAELKSEKTAVVKDKKTKKAKPEKQRVSLKSKIKSKFEDMKKEISSNKEKKDEKKEENLKYSTVSAPINENSANRFIQVKPRNNYKNFIPKFDNSINDM